MRSCVTSKNVSWPQLTWPALYMSDVKLVSYGEYTE